MHQTPKDALLDAIRKQEQKRADAIKLLDLVEFGTIKIIKQDGKIIHINVDMDGEALVEIYNLAEKNP